MVRPLKYGSPTTERKIRLTDGAWEYLHESALLLGYKARADLFEALVTGEAQIIKTQTEPAEVPCISQVEAAIAAVLPTIPIKDRNQAHKWFKKLLAQLEEK